MYLQNDYSRLDGYVQVPIGSNYCPISNEIIYWYTQYGTYCLVHGESYIRLLYSKITTAWRENRAITSDLAAARSMEILHYHRVEFGDCPSAFLRWILGTTLSWLHTYDPRYILQPLSDHVSNTTHYVLYVWSGTPYTFPCSEQIMSRYLDQDTELRERWNQATFLSGTAGWE